MLLLGHGADVNAQDGKYSTALHLVASSRSAMKGNVVRVLLSHGANVDAKDDGGQTPFQIVSSTGLSEMAELLLDYQYYLLQYNDVTRLHTNISTALCYH
jgi:ankyrin repeat protein